MFLGFRARGVVKHVMPRHGFDMMLSQKGFGFRQLCLPYKMAGLSKTGHTRQHVGRLMRCEPKNMRADEALLYQHEIILKEFEIDRRAGNDSKPDGETIR